MANPSWKKENIRQDTQWSYYLKFYKVIPYPLELVLLVELIALTRALELETDKRVSIYTDPKYAYLVLHAHTAIWKERNFKTTDGNPIKNY